MVLTQGAMGNLINRYNAVLKKCSLMNTFGSLALAALFVLGGVSGAVAIESTGMQWDDFVVNSSYSPTSASVWIDGTKPTGSGNLGNVTIDAAVTPNGYFVVGNGNVVVGDNGSIELGSGDTFWVSQGDLTVADSGTLSLDGSGSLHVGGNVDIQEGGNLTLNGSGSNQLNVGNNLTVEGSLERNGGGSVTVAGTLSAGDLKINDGKVTAGIAKVTGSISIGGGGGNGGVLTIGQLDSKGTVLIGGSATQGTLTLGKADSTASTEHTTAGITISKGTLELKGSNTITGGVTLKGASFGTAVLSADNGVNNVDAVAMTNQYGTIQTTGTLNIGTLTAEGFVLAINGTGVTNVDTFLVKDTVNTVNINGNVAIVDANGDSKASLSIADGKSVTAAGTLKLSSGALTTMGTGKVNVTGTVHFTDERLTYTMATYGAGNVGTDKNVSITNPNAMLRVDGGLTLVGETSITVNTDGAASTSLFKGTIIANSLSTKAGEANTDLTITKGKVQLVGKNLDSGDKLFTENKKITLDTNGSLILGATGDLGLTKAEGDKFGGTINAIDGTGTVQFAHGDFTVTTANTTNKILFKDDTGWSSKDKPNTVTLGTDANVAYDGSDKLTLGEGWFKVSNGLKADSGAITIAVDKGKTGGYADKITLGGSGKLTTGTGHQGSYTITELQTGSGTVDISSGKVVTETLTLNGSATLKTSGTGTWQIGSIGGSGAGGSTFSTASDSTLLIGGDVSLTYGSKTQFSGFNLDNAGTFGSTGTLTFERTDSNTITIGAGAASKGNYTGSYTAGTVASNEDNTTLAITGGKKLTVTGDGANFFTNVKSITVGDATNSGTLALGGMEESKTFGGKYEGTITLGNATNKGTLEFNGSKITLDKVVVAADAQADYVFNAGETNLTINTGASESNLKAGINLNGTAVTDQTVTLKNGAIATVNGGINVTTGTVNLADGTLNNDIKLDGATVDDAKINVAEKTENTVQSITVDSGGTVALAAGSTLNVNNALDLSKAYLSLTGGAADTRTTLAVNNTLTTGKVTDITSATAGVFNLAGYTKVAAEGLWTVKDSSGAAAIELDNSGTATNLVIATAGINASDFNIGKGDTVSLQGKGGEITLGGGEKLDVKGTLAIDDTSSTWKTDKVTVAGDSVADAKLDVKNGSFTVSTLDLTKGTITVGVAANTETKTTATNGKLFVTDFTKQTAANGSALNIVNGAAYFGTDAKFTAAANTVLAGTEGAVAMLAVNKAVDFSNVNMVVGTQLQAKELFPATSGNIEFGADSVTVIGYDAAGTAGTYAITTNGNVYIDKGAKLELYNKDGLQLNQKYNLLKTDGTIGNVWEASNVLASQRLVKLEISKGHNEVTGTIAEANVAAGFGNKLDSDFAHILGNMLASSGVDVASEQYGVRFLSRSTDRNFIADDKEAAATIEGGAKIAFAGAAPQMAMNLANNAGAVSGLRNSLSAAPQGAAVALNDEGLVAHEGLSAGEGMQNGFGLWVMPTYQNQQGFGLESGNFDTGYKSNAAGVILGADYTFNEMFRVGAQFNVGGGYAESTGDFNSTSNRFKYWGLGVYAGYQYENIGVSADFGYSKNHNELEQNLLKGMQMANLKADAQSDTITAGLRGEYKFATEAIDIVPHLGVRMTNTHIGSFDAKSDKHTIFKADDVNATVWTFPVGVTLSKDFETGNGWTIKPSLDLAVIPAAGDIEAKQDINVVGVSGTAQLESSIMDAISYQGSLGLSAKNDNGMSVGINYTVQAGAHTTDQGVQATLRYDF